tara:strand:+ start:9479 stop:11170 length:1692 start_codon:yes stop_codon:yes gene_type:complete
MVTSAQNLGVQQQVSFAAPQQPQGYPQSAPSMQELQFLRNLNTDTEKFNAANAQFRNNFARPGQAGNLNPFQYEQYQQIRKDYQEKVNTNTRKISELQARRAKLGTQGMNAETRFNKIIGDLKNLQDRRSAYTGMTSGVGEKIAENLSFDINLGRGGNIGAGGFAAQIAAARQALGPNASDYEVAMEARKIGRQVSPGPSRDLMDALTDQIRSADEASGGYGGAAAGGGIAAGLATLAMFIPGVNLGVAGILAVIGGGTVIGGLIDAVVDDDQTMESINAELDREDGGFKVDQNAFESSVLLSVAEGMRDITEAGSSSDRAVFGAVNDLISHVDDGRSMDDIVGRLIQLEDEMGLSMNEIHSSLQSALVSMKKSRSGEVSSRSAILAEAQGLSQESTELKAVVAAQRATDNSISAHDELIRKLEGASLALETFDYNEFTQREGNEIYASNRLVTPEQAEEAAKAVALGTLESYIMEDGSIDPEFTDLLTALDPESASALQELIGTRQEVFSETEDLTEQLFDLSEAVGKNNPDQLEMEDELQGLFQEGQMIEELLGSIGRRGR